MIKTCSYGSETLSISRQRLTDNNSLAKTDRLKCEFVALQGWSALVNRELKNHDEVHDDDVCSLGKDWNENVGFGGKKES